MTNVSRIDRISPDMGPEGPGVDPEVDALEHIESEGLVWVEDAGWVYPDEAGLDDLPPAS